MANSDDNDDPVNENGPRANGSQCNNAKANKSQTGYKIKVKDPLGRMHLFRHKVAQTLWQLVLAGTKGATSGDFTEAGWARRTSHYIFCLRQAGIEILTLPEIVSDGARVGRYVLQTRLILKEIKGFGQAIDFQTGDGEGA